MLRLATRSDYHSLLDAAVLRHTDDQRPAVIYVETNQTPVVVSRAMFHQRVIDYANALHQLGIGAKDLVIIAHTQNLECVYAFWGALVAGAIPSMFPVLTEKLDPAVYFHEMRELVRLSQVRALLTSDDFAPVLAEQVNCPVYGSAALHAAVTSSHPITKVFDQPFDAEATAFLQHSSGTTGLQKGVALSHRAVLNQLASYADALDLNEQDVIVSWLPLYHDMGLIAGFMQPLVQGVPLVLMSPFDWVRHPGLLLHAIHEFRATLCWLPNFAFNHLARSVRQRDSAGLDLSCMRAFINCSEPVRHDSHQLFLDRFAANGIRAEMLTVSYAMAENTFAVTQTPMGQYPRLDWVDREKLQTQQLAAPAIDESHAERVVSCGKAIAHTQIKIVDEAGQVRPERQVGEVMVRSDCMLTGYYRRPDLQPFDDEGWYRTGDRGYFADGELYIVGRSKDLIINAGKNIYPQDIEAIVNTVSGVHPGRAVVFGVADEREGTELIAVIAEVDAPEDTQRSHIIKDIRQTVGRSTDVTVSYVTLVEKAG